MAYFIAKYFIWKLFHLTSILAATLLIIQSVDGKGITPCDGIIKASELRRKEELVVKCDVCCPRLLMPVCGTDGQTYVNEWCLKNAICQSDGKIQKARDGSCEPSNPFSMLNVDE